jgi:thymidylate synthase (FAD)
VTEEIQVLDHGYVKLIESWGSDERVIESARMSTGKGFVEWGPRHSQSCGYIDADNDPQPRCTCGQNTPGDEKLLKFLWDNSHGTPFEMAGITIEVKAPIFVLREWHRHRVPFGYNEMSSRYVPLPDENYVPTVDRLFTVSKENRQAGTVAGSDTLTEERARLWLDALDTAYAQAESVYRMGLQFGIPKELARLPVPVARYSRMRATSNLRGWLGFLKLRCAVGAQWEIRQYANEVTEIVRERFPRTYAVARESVGMP